ncbi:sigma-70 family RNA polymerase sigma factor [Flavobacteriaceae bacterium F08102]|nr:sigma-70 family RNA polymerase sigma factor [Flavobacteriaceae bacterium F08102]
MVKQFKDSKVLISHLKEGKESAYVYLVKTYHTPLINYAVSLTNDRDMAKDIVQEVFLLIWKDRKKMGQIFALKSYLYKKTYHQFINMYRKNNAITTIEQAFLKALNNTVDDANKELLERKIAVVKESITKLPKRCKETFLLSKKEGLTNIEIAEYLNVSIKTVEGHLTKAYTLLRKNAGDQLKSVLFLLFGTRAIKVKK